MVGLNETVYVTFVGGPWDGLYGTMSGPLVNSLDARDPKPYKRRADNEPPPQVAYFWRGTVYQRHIEIDKLVAGRELDTLVEERVMHGGPGTTHHYSKSPSETARVKRRLQKLGWTRVGKGTRPGPGVPVTVLLQHDNGGAVEATGQGFEEALCKAALKAVEP